MIVTHFYRLYTIMAGSKIIAGSQPKVHNLIIVVCVSVLLPICCHIGSGMPYMGIFDEDVVTLLGAITDKLVLTLVCGQNLNISNDQVKFAAKNINAQFFACELWVKRVGTFGVVLYRNQ